MKAGLRPSMAEAIKAKCYECLANCSDGRKDCRSIYCPLYVKHPFRKLNPNLDWIFGRWQKRYTIDSTVIGLSKEKYIKNKIIKPGKKFKISIPNSKIIRAKCFECFGDFDQGGGSKGKIDCEISECPLYFWMPYRKDNLPTFNWLFDSGHTKKHYQEMIINGMTREEYIESFLGSKKQKTIIAKTLEKNKKIRIDNIKHDNKFTKKKIRKIRKVKYEESRA